MAITSPKNIEIIIETTEMKIDVENELAQYIKKGIEIDKENKEIIIY